MRRIGPLIRMLSSDLSGYRDRLVALSACALVALMAAFGLLPSQAHAANNPYIPALFAEPTYTPAPIKKTDPGPVIENCKGVAPAVSSGKDSPTNPLTDKELNTGQGQVTGVTNSFLPGGTVHWIVTFPNHPTTSSFDIRDCVVAFYAGNTTGIQSVLAHENNGEVDPMPGDEHIVKSYSAVLDTGQFEWADGLNLNGEFDLGWTTPANVPPGTIICDYVKTTGGGSAGKGGDRKAGFCFTVAEFSPALSTTQVATQSLGGQVSDVAHLTGGSPTPLTGTLTFNFFGPNDPNCSGSVVYTHDVNVSGSGDYNSGSFMPTTAGTYQWTAHYSGDANNKPADSACGSERVEITPPGAGTLPGGGANGAANGAAAANGANGAAVALPAAGAGPLQQDSSAAFDAQGSLTALLLALVGSVLFALRRRQRSAGAKASA